MLGALPYAVERGRRVGAVVGILIFSSADPLHDGDGKRKYCDILGLCGAWYGSGNAVYFLCCICAARLENMNKLWIYQHCVHYITFCYILIFRKNAKIVSNVTNFDNDSYFWLFPRTFQPRPCLVKSLWKYVIFTMFWRRNPLVIFYRPGWKKPRFYAGFPCILLAGISRHSNQKPPPVPPH